MRGKTCKHFKGMFNSRRRIQEVQYLKEETKGQKRFFSSFIQTEKHYKYLSSKVKHSTSIM